MNTTIAKMENKPNLAKNPCMITTSNDSIPICSRLWSYYKAIDGQNGVKMRGINIKKI
jgi:hypothetical protein